ncbi:YueI family protein [Numidum massiliense]|uniref:YueI family protein n=1 Tax=Numidum massiliense TaxID=1522315 RepID=UPI0006D59972|nr:YueI family protein [Numidum massiliense]
MTRREDELQRTLQEGIYGTPELKPEEKRLYLGEFRERVIAAIRFKQLSDNFIKEQVEEQLQMYGVKVMKFHHDVLYEQMKDYVTLAERYKVAYTTVNDAEYKREYAIVLASDHAVDKADIVLKTEREQLLARGVPEAIIDAAGEDLCDDCRAIVSEKAPEILRRYGDLNVLERIVGKRCAACDATGRRM